MPDASTLPAGTSGAAGAPFRFDGSRGEAFVLVHGFTGIPGHFRPLGADLHRHGYTVNAPLLPGHGGSIEALARVTRADWIDATIDAIREVGDHRSVHLVGLSMGGLLSIVAANKTGVRTVTTINAPVRFRDRRMYAASLLRFVRPVVIWPEEPPPPLEPDVAPYWIHTSGFPTRAAAELMRLSRLALREARKVSIPSLVIQSRVDETTDPRSGPILQRRLGGRLLWLESSMHNALFDRERHVIRDAVLATTRS